MLLINELWQKYEKYLDEQELRLDKGEIEETDIMDWDEFRDTYIDFHKDD